MATFSLYHIKLFVFRKTTIIITKTEKNSSDLLIVRLSSIPAKTIKIDSHTIVTN